MEVNNLLCFLSAAKCDYSTETLSDIIVSFYSYEEIKVAKTLLSNIVKKDIVWRRDPDKKRRDLQDVFALHDECVESRLKIKFVANSHKTMPPMGLEMMAPLVNNLADEVKKINEVLPKILDIKSEVCNIADTVRALKIDVMDLSK